MLRLLQEGEVKPLGCDQVEYTDIRIISATNKPLEPLVEQQAFRKDLFFRLSAVKLKIPPLRERPEDIQLLTNVFIEKYNIKFQKKISGISPSLDKKFTLYQWPGNVRELENEISYMVALAQGGEILSDKHLVSQHIVEAKPLYDPMVNLANAAAPVNLPITGNNLSESVAALEKMLIEKSLAKHYWNQSKAAKELGLSRMGLANKLKRYNLKGNTHLRNIT